MTHHFYNPILARYIRARYSNEYHVALHPIPSVNYHINDAIYEIEPQVIAVYRPTGEHYPNGDIEFEYVGIRIIK